MKSKVTLLLVGLSFVVTGVGECASLFGPGAPEMANAMGTPLSVDLSQTSAAKGKIGDPVGCAVATAGDPNPVGTPLGIDLSKTPAARGQIGDPVGVAVATAGDPNPLGNRFK
jgi:hypothetical protein